MPIPTGIENLSTTPASNNPAGSENVSEGDDHLRNLYAFLRQSFTAGADIASASTITPPSTGGSFNLTGTTTVTAIATTNSWSGRKIRFRHTGAHSFTQSASLVCPGGVSITFANGDISEWAQNPSGGWEITTYIPVSFMSAPAFIPTGSAVPARGVYLSAADTVAISTVSTFRWSVDASGNVAQITSVNSALSNNINNSNAGASASVAIGVTSNNGTLQHQMSSTAAGGTATSSYSGTNVWNIYCTSNTGMNFGTNNTARVSIGAAGNITANAPTSGTTFAVTGVSGGTPISVSAAGAVYGVDITNSGANDGQMRNNTSSATQSAVFVSALNSVAKNYYGVAGSGGAYVTGAVQNDTVMRAESANICISPDAGSNIDLKIISTASVPRVKITDAARALFNAGFLEVPQNIQNANYTAVLSDSAKHIYHSDGTAYTWTIPANSSVAYPTGTVLTFVNDGSAGNITIAITTDVLVFSPGGSTGSRTLAINGRASALKVSATRWQITGTALT